MAAIFAVNITPILNECLGSLVRSHEFSNLPEYDPILQLKTTAPAKRLSRAVIVAPTVVQQIQSIVEPILEQLVAIAEESAGQGEVVKKSIDRMKIYQDVFKGFLEQVASNSQRALWITYGTKYRKHTISVQSSCSQPTIGSYHLTLNQWAGSRNWKSVMFYTSSTSLISAKRMKDWTITLVEMFSLLAKAKIKELPISDVWDQSGLLAALEIVPQVQVQAVWPKG